MGFGVGCEFIVIVVSILLIHVLRVRIPAMFVIPFVFVSMKVHLVCILTRHLFSLNSILLISCSPDWNSLCDARFKHVCKHGSGMVQGMTLHFSQTRSSRQSD